MTSTQTQNHGTLHGSSINHSQGTFVGANQIKLFYQSWYPKAASGQSAEPSRDISTKGKADTGSASARPVKGILAIVHGLGEHSGRYCNVVGGAIAANYAVYGFDNQGHGKSEGQRGHIKSWQDYRDNVQAFLQIVRKQAPTAPIFLMGHSLGGLIVLDYVLRNEQDPSFQALDISGILVSAPPIQPVGSTAHSARAIFAKLLSGVLPRFTLKMCLDEGGLSRDQAVEERAQQDPLVHPYVTLRWGAETIATINWVEQHIANLKLPIVLTHGSADSIIDPAGSKRLFEKITSPRKTLRIYPGSYHEPHNDLDADIVTADIVSWLDHQISALPTR